ncbi:MAG: hypothetical protein ACLR6J_07745 [Parabacteroides merdae]
MWKSGRYEYRLLSCQWAVREPVTNRIQILGAPSATSPSNAVLKRLGFAIGRR